MTIGLIGRKAGMTRIFTEEGASVPVTVIEVQPNRVTQVKTAAVDGYRAVQVAIGERRASRVTKPMAGHYARAGVTAGDTLREFRLAEGEGLDLAEGGEILVSIFSPGRKLMSVASLKDGDLPAVSNATTSGCRMPPMATRSPTGRRVPSGSVRHRVGS